MLQAFSLSTRQLGILCWILLFITTASFTISMLLSRDVAHYQFSDSRSCGSTRAEAVSNGCQFDMMSFCWLHPDCFDAELTESFLTSQAWSWYSDRDPTTGIAANEIPRDVAESANYDRLYVSWQYHLVHCVFMWKKLHRAISSTSPIDSYIGNLHHTNHCSDNLLRQDLGFNLTNTAIEVKYPYCDIPRRRRILGVF